jgi:hypothetical protein
MAMLAFERKLIMAKRVARYDADIKEKGSSVKIPQVTNLTTNAVGSSGTYVGQAPTENAYTITIDRWREASISVPDIVDAQSAYPLLELYTKKIGYALAQDVEDQLMGLYSGLANQVGTASVAVTDDVILNAIQLLDEGDCPLEDRTLVFRPASKRTLMKIEKFVNANMTGLGKGAQVTGLFGEIYGIPIFFSNQVNSSSGIHNLLFHKEAFGLAMQIDIKIEKFRLKLADDVVGHVLYGKSELRDGSNMGTAAVDILT